MRIEAMKIKHFVDFMQHKRPKDVREIEIINNCPLGEIPVLNYADATVLVDDDDNVYAIGGVQQADVNLHIVWMLCTDRVEKHQITFLRTVKELLVRYLEKYNHLENVVWLGNEQHVKWLKWMGAKFFDVHKINGEDFQSFMFTQKE
jgi:hypothetical protein